jgi:Hydantoinase/oxoprolinase N-terminal region
VPLIRFLLDSSVSGRYNNQESEFCILFPERITRPAQRNAAMLRLGIDVGGTLTDFALYREATGDLPVCTCLTTPAAPAQAVLQGIATLLDEPLTLGVPWGGPAGRG